MLPPLRTTATTFFVTDLLSQPSTGTRGGETRGVTRHPNGKRDHIKIVPDGRSLSCVPRWKSFCLSDLHVFPALPFALDHPLAAQRAFVLCSHFEPHASPAAQSARHTHQRTRLRRQIRITEKQPYRKKKQSEGRGGNAALVVPKMNRSVLSVVPTRTALGSASVGGNMDTNLTLPPSQRVAKCT